MEDMSDLYNEFYSPLVLKHSRNPKNIGVIKDADGVAEVGNPVCGDVMRFYIKVDKRGSREYLKEVKYQTLGCGAAIATSSMITVMLKGKPLSEAEKFTKTALIKALGGLPPSKIHCSVLADEGIKKAIENYREKSKRKDVRS